jgi:hypothetical protein
MLPHGISLAKIQVILNYDFNSSEVDHSWEQWREEVREDKLHLGDERRMMLGRMVNNYFRFNTN